ncbi:MAG: tannase/feruloyl esterase family alpha/beta hydrolase, partial [Steroidobacteraceae bacterium]
PFGIRFALDMPEKWNGRFLFQGGGGLNGSVGEPLGFLASGATPALARGFAVVSTDTGHEGHGPFDATFLSDQQASLDFYYEAIGRVARVGERIVADYYGHRPARSYFVGCSTGGREAMVMAERYPTYFDGIVAGDPAMRTGFSNLADRWVVKALDQIAPRDAAGHPIASRAFSVAERKLIVNAILEQCDALDGLRDGLIENPLACHFDPARIECSGPTRGNCLSARQVMALKQAFAGPKDSLGRQVYPGFFFDTGIAASRGVVVPGLLAGAPSPVAGVPPWKLNVDAAEQAAQNDPSRVGDTDRWTNLSTFSGHGGKLIFYHGVSDPWFSAKDTIDYYRRLAADNGGARIVMQWSRLFLVPGMNHCATGPATLDQFDMLSAIVDWVEKGRAPNSVVATGRSFPGRSRPLCPYPEHAQYRGGNPQSASSFECRT